MQNCRYLSSHHKDPISSVKNLDFKPILFVGFKQSEHTMVSMSLSWYFHKTIKKKDRQMNIYQWLQRSMICSLLFSANEKYNIIYLTFSYACTFTYTCNILQYWTWNGESLTNYPNIYNYLLVHIITVSSVSYIYNVHVLILFSVWIFTQYLQNFD